MSLPRSSLSLLLVIFVATSAAADYVIEESVVASGGGAGAGGSYSLLGTVGQPVIGTALSATNTAEIGFWYQPGWILTGITDPDGPLAFRMNQNAPNPFNPVTTLSYSVAARTHVTISVYNVSGRLVKTLVDESKEAGRFETVLDARGLTSGVYFARMTAGDFVETTKMVLLK